MYIAVDNEGKRTQIDSAIDGVKYFCPICRGVVIQKRGTINAHHFSHEKLCDCDEWGEMSEWHYKWQCRFKEDNREVILGNHRADVFVNGTTIEFQHSPLSETELNERIIHYTKYGKLVFVFDTRDKDIYKGDDFYIWKYASKSIIPPNNKNYFVFFQVSDNELLFAKSQNDGWKEFSAFKVVTVKQFENMMNDNIALECLMKISELEGIILEKNMIALNLRKTISNLRVDAERNDFIFRKKISKINDDKTILNKELSILYARQAKQREHIHKILEENRLIKKGKIEEIIVEVEKEVIKEVYVDKFIKINKKELEDAIILEFGRYFSSSTENSGREKIYPRKLFEERLKNIIDTNYDAR